jgi:Tfp pilus assembly protein PilO
MRTLQSQILRYARAQRVLAGALLLAAGAFYVLGYRPAAETLRQLERQVAARNAELKQNQTRTSLKAEIAAHNERLKVELDRIRKPSRREENAQLLKDLTHFAEAADLKKFINALGKNTVRSDLFIEQPIALTFDGDFVSVFKFLRSVEEMPRLTRMRSMTLKAKSNQPADAGQVQATISMNMYFATD